MRAIGDFKIFEENLTEIDMERESIEVGDIIVGKVTSCDANLTCSVDIGIGKGTCELNEIELVLGKKEQVKRVSALSRVGKYSYFKVTNIYEDGIVLSRKEVQEEYMQCLIKMFLDSDGLRQIDGLIVNKCERFMFVDIGYGVTGILGMDRLTESALKEPEEELKDLKYIKVIITNLEEDKIDLSHKELLGNWEQIVSEFEIGSAYIGVVTSVADFGTFVRIHPNLVALADKNTTAKIGDEVCVFIKDIDYVKKRVKLRIVSVAKESGERDKRIAFDYVDALEVPKNWKFA